MFLVKITARANFWSMVTSFNSILRNITFYTLQLEPLARRYTPEMVWVLGGHANTQCIQDTLGVVEAERGWWQFLSGCWSLEEKRTFRVDFVRLKKKNNIVRAGNIKTEKINNFNQVHMVHRVDYFHSSTEYKSCQTLCIQPEEFNHYCHITKVENRHQRINNELICSQRPILVMLAAGNVTLIMYSKILLFEDNSDLIY